MTEKPGPEAKPPRKKRATTRRRVGETSKSGPKKGRSTPPAASQGAPPPAQDVPRTVQDLVLAGVTKGAIRDFLRAELKYRPGAGELNALIDQAKADLVAQAEHYTEIATELTIVRLNELFLRAANAGELKVALDIQKSLATFLVGRAAARKAGDAEPEIPSSGDEPPVEPGRPRLAGGYEEAMRRARRA